MKESWVSIPWFRYASRPERREALRVLQAWLYVLCRSKGFVAMDFGDRRLDAFSWASHAGSRGGGSLKKREGIGSMTTFLGI